MSLEGRSEVTSSQVGTRAFSMARKNVAALTGVRVWVPVRAWLRGGGSESCPWALWTEASAIYCVSHWQGSNCKSCLMTSPLFKQLREWKEIIFPPALTPSTMQLKVCHQMACVSHISTQSGGSDGHHDIALPSPPAPRSFKDNMICKSPVSTYTILRRCLVNE